MNGIKIKKPSLDHSKKGLENIDIQEPLTKDDPQIRSELFETLPWSNHQDFDNCQPSSVRSKVQSIKVAPFITEPEELIVIPTPPFGSNVTVSKVTPSAETRTVSAPRPWLEGDLAPETVR